MSCAVSSPNKRKLVEPGVVVIDSDEDDLQESTGAESKTIIKDELPEVPIVSKEIDKSNNAKGKLESTCKGFLHILRLFITPEEFEIVTRKFDKRLRRMTEDPTSLNVLSDLLARNSEKIKETPLKAFVFLKEIFDEFDLRASVLHSSTTKKRRLKPEKVNVVSSVQENLEKSSKPIKNGEKIVKFKVPASPSTDHHSASASGSSGSKVSDDRPLADVQLKNKQRIKKLERALKECHEAIKKCEEEELSLDDMDKEDSAYTRLDRYRRKFVSIQKCLCKLKEERLVLGRQQDRRVTVGDLSRTPAINAAIELFINRRIVKSSKNSKRKQFKEPVFPDFHEVLEIYNKVVDENHLGYTSEDIHNEATETFKALGAILKRRRMTDHYMDMIGYLPDEKDMNQDPANEDESLAQKLCESVKVAQQKTNEVMDEFVRKQIERKDVPEDIDEGSDTSSNSGEDDEGGSDDSEDEGEEGDKESDVSSNGFQ